MKLVRQTRSSHTVPGVSALLVRSYDCVHPSCGAPLRSSSLHTEGTSCVRRSHAPIFGSSNHDSYPTKTHKFSHSTFTLSVCLQDATLSVGVDLQFLDDSGHLGVVSHLSIVVSLLLGAVDAQARHMASENARD